MKKFKYLYRPNDNEEDYRLGATYKGKVSRIILTRNNHHIFAR